MKEIFAEEGQNLLSGEPIGEMGDSELYIEIRDKETPINPLKYFKF
jgi:septal ring factor EnvC (AmiA/AmiB activator)